MCDWCATLQLMATIVTVFVCVTVLVYLLIRND